MSIEAAVAVVVGGSGSEGTVAAITVNSTESGPQPTVLHACTLNL